MTTEATMQYLHKTRPGNILKFIENGFFENGAPHTDNNTYEVVINQSGVVVLREVDDGWFSSMKYAKSLLEWAISPKVEIIKTGAGFFPIPKIGHYFCDPSCPEKIFNCINIESGKITFRDIDSDIEKTCGFSQLKQNISWTLLQLSLEQPCNQ